MRSLPIVVLAVALGTAACGGGSGSSAGAATSAAAGPASVGATAAATTKGGSSAAGDPCSLTNADEVKALFGGSVAAGNASSSAALVLPTCRFAVTGSNLGGDGTVVVALLTTLSDKTKFGYAKAGLPGATDVPGVGDSAFYNPQVTALEFFKGGKAVMVQGIFGIGGTKPDPGKIKAEIVDLAGKVAGKV